MPEIFANNAIIHVQGRQLGLQFLFTAASGAATANGPKYDLLTGPDAMRQETTTANTTAANLKALGTASLNGTSVASSAVYTLDPPIPGIRKTIALASTANGPIYIKNANSEVLVTTGGSSFTVSKITAGVLELQGLTTASWAVLSAGPGFAFTTTT